MSSANGISEEEFDRRTSQFQHWFTSQVGSELSGDVKLADLRCQGGGRGMITTKHIEPGTTLFTIPRSAVITTQTSYLSKEIPGLFDGEQGGDGEGADLDPWSSLILVLIYEYLQGQKSRWYPYFQLLPTQFDTPMFWSDDELAELQASPLKSKVGKDDAEKMFQQSIIPIVRKHLSVFQGSDTLSDQDLVQLAHKMGSTIMAYAFELEGDHDEEDEQGEEEDGWVEDRDGKGMMGMVPMADMLNADAEFNAHINHGEDALTATAIRAIQPGEEILNYYGPHPTSELLRRYGYVTPKHSRYDVVEVPWILLEAALADLYTLTSDEAQHIRQQIDEYEFEDTFVIERESGEVSPGGEFDGDAAFQNIPDELKDQLKGCYKVMRTMGKAGPANREERNRASARIVAKALGELLSRYPTSADTDEELLQQKKESYRKMMAIHVRLGEKRLIQEAIEVLQEDATDDEPVGDEPASKRARIS